MLLEDYKPSTPAKISCRSDGETSTLVFERRFSHPPERVWRALTAKEQIPKWAPYGPDRDLDTVGPASLHMNDGSEPPDYDISVDEVVPGKLLRHSWGLSVLEWQLEASDNGTRLILNHSVPNPEWVTSAAAGWHLCFDFVELLMNGIEFGPIVPVSGEAAMAYGWEKLARHYASVLGMPDPTVSDGEDEQPG